MAFLRFIFQYHRGAERITAGAARAGFLHAEEAIGGNHAVPATGPNAAKELQATVLVGVHNRAADTSGKKDCLAWR